MACVLNAPLKKYMSCFALKMSISLKDPLKMRSGEFVAKVTRSVAFFRLFLVAPIHLSSFGLFRLLKLSTWIRLLHYALTKRFRKNLRKRKEISNSSLCCSFVRAFLRFKQNAALPYNWLNRGSYKFKLDWGTGIRMLIRSTSSKQSANYQNFSHHRFGRYKLFDSANDYFTIRPYKRVS